MLHSVPSQVIVLAAAEAFSREKRRKKQNFPQEIGEGQEKQKARTHPGRSEQGSNLRGEDPIGFQVQRLNHSAIAADATAPLRLQPYRVFRRRTPRPQPTQPMGAAGPGPAPAAMAAAARQEQCWRNKPRVTVGRFSASNTGAVSAPEN